MNAATLLIAVIFFGAPLLLAADDKKEPEKKEPVEEKTETLDDKLQRLSSVGNVLKRRDPFMDAEPEFVKRFKKKIIQSKDNKEPTQEINRDDLPPLQRYATERYEVVAILTNAEKPRALVKVPNSGNRIVMKSMSLGDRGGVIMDISPDGLVVEERIKNSFGDFETERISIPVGVSLESTQ